MFNDAQTPAPEDGESKGSPAKMIAIVFTLLLLVAVGVRVFLIHRERVEAEKPAETAETTPGYTEDQMVLPRRLHQTDLKDARELNNKPVWVFAAGQLNAYPATPAKIDYAHPGPLLLGVDQLQVVNFVEQKAPESAYSRIPKGDAQVVMLFHRKDDPGKLWGTPVGDREGKFYNFFIDECFFYDDPHTLYKHWKPEVWKAIEEHKAIKGMNELQTDLALGQVSKPGPGKQGDRTVVFDNNGHPVTVTFEHDKATSIS
jgi:hypothetical protein